MKIIIAIVFCISVAGASVMMNACKKSNGSNFGRPTPLEFTVPNSFPQPVYNFQGNPLTVEGFALGKQLFYDSRLSKGTDVNCGSCHQQHAAYTQFDHDLGHGTNHQHTTRNVPGIFNMAWHTSFQWDGSVQNLIDQPLACLTAPEKMGETVEEVADKLRADDTYRQLFGKAFGDENISGERISKALVQFVGSIISANSKYDKIKKGQATFNPSEQSGYVLFQSKCTPCHAEPLFTDFSFRNNGLALNEFNIDYGRMMFTGISADSLKFKVPSLRNIGLTSYYGHDGRYTEFSEMINHYSEGTLDGPTLDPQLANGIPLTDLEKFYLHEFLLTLDDSSLVSDPRFAAP